MKKNLDQLIDQLEHDLENDVTYSKAADYLRKAAVKGQDIESAVDMLVRVIDEAEQVPFIESAAKALVYHLVRLADISRLFTIMRGATWSSYLSDALFEATKRNLDLTEVLTELITTAKQRPKELALATILSSYIKGSVKRLKLVLPLAATRDATLLSSVLISFLYTCKKRPIDISFAVPHVLPLLEGRSVKKAEEAAHFCSVAAELGMSITPYLEVLAKRLSGKASTVRDLAARALTHASIAGSEWSYIDLLRQNKHAEVRRQLYVALGTAVYIHQNSDQQVIDHLWMGFLDEDEKVRSDTAYYISNSFEYERKVLPSPEAVTSLLPGLCRKKSCQLIARWLERAVEESAGNLALASALCEAFAKAKRARTSKVGAALYALVRGLTEGDAELPCPVCLRLPRSRRWNWECDVPKEVKELSKGEIYYHCPQCHAVYSYFSVGEWDDMCYDETWYLRRLSPTECLEKTKGKVKAWYAENYDRVIEHQPVLLEHPTKKLRADATWILVEHLLAAGDWSAIEALLDHKDPVIRLAALDTIARLRAAPSQAFYYKRLIDKDVSIRSRAASAMVERALRTGHTTPVYELLTSKKREILFGVLSVLRRHGEGNKDISEFAAELQALVKLGRKGISGQAGLILNYIPWDKRQGTLTVGALLVKLSSRRRADQLAAAEGLASLAVEGKDISEALPVLIAMLSKKTTARHATVTIVAAARQGCDVSAALPAVVRARKRVDFERTMYSLFEAGVDLKNALPAITSAMVTVDSDDRQWLLPIVEELSAKGHDFSSQLRMLAKAIHKVDEDERSRLARVLGRQWLRQGKWRSITSRLRRPRTRQIHWGLCEALEEAVEQGQDISPVVSALIPLLKTKSDILRQHLTALLAKHFRRKSCNRAKHVSQLAKLPASLERDELLALCNREPMSKACTKGTKKAKG